MRNLRKYIQYGLAALFLSAAFILNAIHRHAGGLGKSWIVFGIWTFVAAAFIGFLWWLLPLKIRSWPIRIISQDWKYLLLVLIVAGATRFFFLGYYPFVYIGDPVRDGGLYALNMKKGIISDPFGLGAYEGYGLFVPLLVYPFLLVFGNTPFALVTPSVLVGIAAILTLYFLGRYIGGRSVALIASILLLTSPYHLHYSRFELLMNTDSLLVPLLAFAVLLAQKTLAGFLATGFIAGFSLHFYSGMRGLVVLSLSYLIGWLILQLLSAILCRERRPLKFAFQQFVIAAGGLLMGFLIGLGPTINTLKIKNTIQQGGTQRLIMTQPEFQRQSRFQQARQLVRLYENALRTYTSIPLFGNRVHMKRPLLETPLNIFFVIGAIGAMVQLGLTLANKKSSLWFFLLLALLVHPITNQVVINAIGHEHRLIGILPLASLVVAYGMTVIFDLALPPLRFVAVGALVLLLISVSANRLYYYFIKRASDIEYYSNPTREFAFQQLAMFLKKQSPTVKHYLVNNDPNFNISFMHYREKLDFFSYPINIQVIEPDAIDSILHKPRSSGLQFYVFETIPSQLATFEKEYIEFSCQQKGLLPIYSCPLNNSQPYGFIVLKQQKST